MVKKTTSKRHELTDEQYEKMLQEVSKEEYDFRKKPLVKKSILKKKKKK